MALSGLGTVTVDNTDDIIDALALVNPESTGGDGGDVSDAEDLTEDDVSDLGEDLDAIDLDAESDAEPDADDEPDVDEEPDIDEEPDREFDPDGLPRPDADADADADADGDADADEPDAPSTVGGSNGGDDSGCSASGQPAPKLFLLFVFALLLAVARHRSADVLIRKGQKERGCPHPQGAADFSPPPHPYTDGQRRHPHRTCARARLWRLLPRTQGGH